MSPPEGVNEKAKTQNKWNQSKREYAAKSMEQNSFVKDTRENKIHSWNSQNHTINLNQEEDERRN